MELKRAIEVLTLYNQWRIGENVEMMQPSTITVALNKVIENYHQREKEKTKKPSI